MLKKIVMLLISAMLIVVLTTSCASAGTGKDSLASPTAATAHVDSRCTSSVVSLADLPSVAADEPHLVLPKPSGWTLSTDENPPRIRGVIFNRQLTAQGFTPNFVVSLDDVTEDADTAEQALNTEVVGLAQLAAIDSDSTGVLCGYPSRNLTYEHESRAAATLMVAGKGPDNKVWIAKVDTQTAEPDNPEYVAAKKVIFEGFQFSLSNNRA